MAAMHQNQEVLKEPVPPPRATPSFISANRTPVTQVRQPPSLNTESNPDCLSQTRTLFTLNEKKVWSSCRIPDNHSTCKRKGIKKPLFSHTIKSNLGWHGWCLPHSHPQMAVGEGKLQHFPTLGCHSDPSSCVGEEPDSYTEASTSAQMYSWYLSPRLARLCFL